MPNSMNPVLGRVKKRVNDWLWDNHGDAYDTFLERRHKVIHGLRNARCRVFGHKIEYMPPGPWDWDGEYRPYCDRCNPDGCSAAVDCCEMTLPLRLTEAYWNLRWRLGLVRDVE